MVNPAADVTAVVFRILVLQLPRLRQVDALAARLSGGPKLGVG